MRVRKSLSVWKFVSILTIKLEVQLGCCVFVMHPPIELPTTCATARITAAANPSLKACLDPKYSSHDVHNQERDADERSHVFNHLCRECKSLGFNTIDLNDGSLELPEETLLRFVRLIKIGGLKAKSQFAIRFNKSDIPVGGRAFGAYAISSPRSEFVEDVDLLITRAERCLEAGADMRTIDADDVRKHAGSMHADIIAKVIGRLGAERTVFEASYPRTSEWFLKQYGLLQEKLYGVELIFKIDHEVLISRIVRQK
ncbi:hypothetical protein ACFX1X_037332 [Malus domestica]